MADGLKHYHFWTLAGLSMMSDAFRVICGVRQGRILSPILFSIYIDDIIAKMRQSGYGIYIGTQFVGCILYADDIDDTATAHSDVAETIPLARLDQPDVDQQTQAIPSPAGTLHSGFCYTIVIACLWHN